MRRVFPLRDRSEGVPSCWSARHQGVVRADDQPVNVAGFRADEDARRHAFIAFDRRLYERGGDVIRVLSESRRQHPELGAAHDEGRQRGDSQRRTAFSS